MDQLLAPGLVGAVQTNLQLISLAMVLLLAAAWRLLPKEPPVYRFVAYVSLVFIYGGVIFIAIGVPSSATACTDDGVKTLEQILSCNGG